MPDGKERRLLELAQGGDAQAYGSIVEFYDRRVYFAALGILRNPDDAADLAQEAFVRAFRELSKFDTSRPFYPWLYRLLRNLCLNHIRWRSRRREDSLDKLEESGHFLESDSDPSRAAELSDLRRQLELGMARIQPKFREILMLREFQEHSYEEIANLLEIPRGTVMSRLPHARRNLRAELESIRHGEAPR